MKSYVPNFREKCLKTPKHQNLCPVINPVDVQLSNREAYQVNLALAARYRSFPYEYAQYHTFKGVKPEIYSIQIYKLLFTDFRIYSKTIIFLFLDKV